jgi:hypothetical protein
LHLGFLYVNYRRLIIAYLDTFASFKLKFDWRKRSCVTKLMFSCFKIKLFVTEPWFYWSRGNFYTGLMINLN